ncbi:zinc finger protein 862-like [Mytilus edulis]|uniref:zinc finger protein 862-like n=1 Tax=Mytilus edulis TaxID=6550 RepID=UPI0039EE1285
MDGAAVNMGAKNGVAKQINDQVNNKVIVMHCVAHKLELGILDAVKDVVYLKKIEVELKRISSHMEEILNKSKRCDEIGQAKAILGDLTQVKFVKYIHLNDMLDVLGAISATSKLFQVKDLMIFEVKAAMDTLFSKIHAMRQEPSENLSVFYEKYDVETKMFDGRLALKGNLIPFKDDKDVSTLLEKIGNYVLKSGVISDEESKNAHEEWQTLKVQVSFQKDNYPLIVYCDLLKRQQDDSFRNINVLIEIMLTISSSSAACERVFSQMNIIKSPLRSKLTQENLQNQMQIVVNGVSIKEFDPRPSVVYWLKSGNRHLTHKLPVKATSEAVASHSQDRDVTNVRPLLQDLVKSLGGEEAARAKLKEMASSEPSGSDQCSLM